MLLRLLCYFKTMDYDYSKRNYLLPKGCKDLIDVLKLAPKQKPSSVKTPWQPVPPPSKLPPIIGEISFPENMTVRDLASLLGQKPFKILADAMELGVFANVKQTLNFEIASAIARKYGYTARISG